MLCWIRRKRADSGDEESITLEQVWGVVRRHDEQLSRIETKVTTLETKVAVVDGKVDELSDTVKGLVSTVDAIYDLLNTTVNMKADRRDVTDLNQRMGAMEGNVQDLQGAVDNLRSEQKGFFERLMEMLTPSR